METVAIIGAGFAGLAAAWHLSPDYKVTVYDSTGIGAGASGMAAGLLHAYTGARARKKEHADEALSASHDLLKSASEALGKPIFSQPGILRIALTEEQQTHFSTCASKYDDVEWWDAAYCQKTVPGLPDAPGIFIRSGITVNCPLYLKGLWKACEKKGAQFEQKTIDTLSHLNSFNKIVVTSAYAALQYTELSSLQLKPVKGQLLHLSWPKDLAPLPFPLNAKAYIAMAPDNKSCYIGGTFEHTFYDDKPNIEAAKEYLLPKAYALFPPLEKAEILGCSSAIRATTPNHEPLMGTIDSRIYYLTGLGSKGLLMHAWLAKQLLS